VKSLKRKKLVGKKNASRGGEKKGEILLKGRETREGDGGIVKDRDRRGRRHSRKASSTKKRGEGR